jgi:hypothetical protein
VSRSVVPQRIARDNFVSTPTQSPQSSRRRISAEQLAEAVHAREAAAFLVEPRVLRRVIKADREITSLGTQVPHRKSYVIGLPRLLGIVARDELHPHDALPEQVILLPLPTPEQLVARDAEEILLDHWRLLFHARVHLALESRLASGELTPATLRARIHCIGQTQFDEIRAVLRSEDMLLPPRDDTSVFVEFAAVYLELRFFAPDLLPQFFPTITEQDAIEAILAEEVDGRAIWEQTRPDGAPEPAAWQGRGQFSMPHVGKAWKLAQLPHAVAAEITAESGEARLRGVDGWTEPATRRRRYDFPEGFESSRGSTGYQAIQKQAVRAEKAGNLVRGAIWRMQAARNAAGKLASMSTTAAHEDMKRLVDRLQAALGFPNAERSAWDNGLRGLLTLCSDDRLTIEGRLLYDVQKVCVDHEREIYTVDLVEWLTSFGRRPIRRPLPAQREVLVCKHLRSALRRLASSRLSNGARDRFARALHEALHHAEAKARDRMRPRIAKALQQVGLRPLNVPEEVARNKIVEELLDKTVESGYLRFGDLRDAISRNQLKLPDLVTWASPGAWWAAAKQRVGQRIPQPLRGLFVVLRFLWIAISHLLFGDHLLAADRQLARQLDGVYHRAELYLRVFQRITSYGFGNHWGRLLNRFVVFPLLGAFTIVVFYQEMAHIAHSLLSKSGEAEVAIADEKGTFIEAIGRAFSGGGLSSLVREWPYETFALVALSVLFLGLINSARCRLDFVRLMVAVGNGLSLAVQWLLNSVVLRLVWAVVQNRWFRFIRRYVLKPLLFTSLVWLVLLSWGMQVGTLWSPPLFFAIFMLFNGLLNTRWGRDVEEISNDFLARSWINFRSRVLAGLFWLVVDLFKAFLEGVDRLLYAVDEWLRFRRGETALSFTGKAILGAIWFVITYVVRFAVNLLIEPQINPIKHFPVVTVSHKVVWALAGIVAPIYAEAMGWPGEDGVLKAFGILSTVAWLIPGIFGFLAWELKENWKLYRANRPATLRPSIIGHHGETMIRFMRPGLHSGTLPKLYRKIRRAHRKARRAGQPAALYTRKHFDQLAHVRHSLANFFERELLYLLRQNPAWRRALAIGEIQLGSNSIRVELLCPELEPSSCWLRFEEQSRFLVAGMIGPGWTAKLHERERHVLRNALIGLYKTSGVHVVQQQVESLLPQVSYDVGDEGLVVWVTDGEEIEAVYDLEQDGPIEPRLTHGKSTRGLPTLNAEDLLFDERPLAWDDWVAAWEPSGVEPRRPRLLPNVEVFPIREKTAGGTGGTPLSMDAKGVR